MKRMKKKRKKKRKEKINEYEEEEEEENCRDPSPPATFPKATSPCGGPVRLALQQNTTKTTITTLHHQAHLATRVTLPFCPTANAE